MPTGETIEGVRIIFHREASGWWAESPNVDGWSVAGETYGDSAACGGRSRLRLPGRGTTARARPTGDEPLSATQAEEERLFRLSGGLGSIGEIAQR